MTTNALPDIIYHYTSFDGLLGILKEKAIWATKIHYLNSSTELLEPIRLIRKNLESCILIFNQDTKLNNKNHEQETTILDHMINDLSRWENTNICVSSFCEDGDLISQWDNGGTSRPTCSIGFDTAKLTEIIKPSGFELCKCEYIEPLAYEKLIQQYVIELINEAKSKHIVPKDFIGNFIKKTATIKFKPFQEENEWRLISSKPLLFDDDKFHFRSGKSTIIPYYSVSLNDLQSIVEIKIGPNQYPNLIQSAVMGLAYSYKLNNVIKDNVKISKIKTPGTSP